MFPGGARGLCGPVCAPLMFQAAWAQSLSLDAALTTALAHHPDLRASMLEREASEGATQQAGAWQNPELSTLVEDTRQATRTTTIQLNQPIELGGKRSARVNATAGGPKAKLAGCWPRALRSDPK